MCVGGLYLYIMIIVGVGFDSWWRAGSVRVLCIDVDGVDGMMFLLLSLPPFLFSFCFLFFFFSPFLFPFFPSSFLLYNNVNHPFETPACLTTLTLIRHIQPRM